VSAITLARSPKRLCNYLKPFKSKLIIFGFQKHPGKETLGPAGRVGLAAPFAAHWTRPPSKPIPSLKASRLLRFSNPLIRAKEDLDTMVYV
jgi:hypothetical protein